MIDDRRLGIEEARLGFTALAARVAAAEPWPLAESFGTAPEASWGPPEVLAHMAEMLSFWLGELERTVDGGPGPVPFGRVAEDAVRIGLIERDRTLPLRVLFGRVDRGLADWITRLERLTEAEARSVGLHPRLGEMTPTQIADRFVIGHAREHVTQLESILAARSSP